MSIDDFLAYLTSIRDKFTWTVIHGQIRGRLKNANCYCCKQCFCPITAVSRVIKGYSMPENSFEMAGKDLKLNLNDMYDIVLSADNNPVHHKYRQQLLEAVGLI